MLPLPPYFARRGLVRLDLSDAVRHHVMALLDLAGADHRINVADIHEKLFSLNSVASANAALNRLLRQLNDAAKNASSPLRAAITADKRAGAKNRWVWFEGAPEAPAPANRSELDAIPQRRLMDDQRGLPLHSPTIVLLTFNEHETTALLRQFHPDGPPRTEVRDGIVYNLLGRHGGLNVVHRDSAQGRGEAQQATTVAIATWRPQAIVGVGIAFGIDPRKQRIGDVLVSRHVRDYELSRVNNDGGVLPRSGKDQASDVLLHRLQHVNETHNAYPERSVHWPMLHFGTLLCGDKLIDNRSFLDHLLAIEPEAIGGEMESSGIRLAAAHRKVDWVIIKAICDWADGNKNSRPKTHDQQLAGKNAALVVHAAITLGGLCKDTPVPPSETGSPSIPRTPGRVPSARSMDFGDYVTIPHEQLIHDVRGGATTLDKGFLHGSPPTVEHEGVDVMDYLLRWVDERDSPPLFALLGEYGMGKTVTCQRLAETLERRRYDDPTRPVPLYLDLRHLTGLDRRVPNLREIVEECMTRGWLAVEESEELGYESFFRWIERGAVVIFDGLDEALVKLREADGQVFTDELLRLPKLAIERARQVGAEAVPPKVLVSCRTQYFRTLHDQKNHFTGQERGEHGAERYRALVLLPLDERQIRRYLAAALPNIEPDRLIETVRSIHDLEELTERPYTLKLIVDLLPEIERERLNGRTVRGVTLYRAMASRWLERDQGKHHIRPQHKMRLAAHLAAHLWRSGRGSLPADDIETWFHAWLETEVDLRRRYAALHPDQLEEDLRTATFLARHDDESRSSFRFAHTSMLEFFLADHLLRGICEDAPDRWAMTPPSEETLDFLGQMLVEADGPSPLRTLERWHAEYRPLTSELIFAYALRALARGWPAPSLRGIRLPGTDLSNRDFRSPPAGPPLDLSGANFDGTNLRRAVFDGVILRGASFRDAQLAQSNWLGCDAARTHWNGSECTAAIWRHANLTDACWRSARGYRPQFHWCTGAVPGATGDAGSGHDMTTPLAVPSELPVSVTQIDRYGPMLRWLPRHSSAIQSCAFFPDGTRLLSSSGDGTLRLWDADSGEVLRVLHGHEGPVPSCAISLKGTRLLSGGQDGTLRLWDAYSGEALRVLRGHEGSLSSCAISLDGTRLLSAGDDGTLRLWDADSGEVLRVLHGHESSIPSCAFAPDGTWLLSAGDDGTLRLWDADSGKALRVLHGHERQLRDPYSGEVLRVLRGHDCSISSCAISSDGTRLLSAGCDGALRVWDAESGKTLQVLRGHEGLVSSCAFAPDDKRLLSAGADGKLQLWDADSGKILHVLHGHEGWAQSCAFAPDGTRLLSVGGDVSNGGDGTLRLWDVDSGEALRVLHRHEGWLQSCAISSNGTRLLSVGGDGALRLWDADSGEALHVLHGHDGWTRCCAFAPDCTRLLSTGEDGTLRLWDADSGEVLHVLHGHEGWVWFCAFAPDGTRLLSAGTDGTLRLWDADSGEALRVLHGHKGWAQSCAFAPDGTWLLSAGGDSTLQTWDADSGEVLRVLHGHEGPISSCTISSDGTRLLSAGEDGTLRLWDADSGEVLHVLYGHDRWVWSCAFAPDCTRLLSAGTDGTLRLWDTGSGEALGVLRGHEGSVSFCTFTPDGTRLLSVGADNTMRLWGADDGRLLRVHAVLPQRHPGHAIWVPDDDRVIEASGNAWRYLAWVRTDEDGRLERLPAEYFGPLPLPRQMRCKDEVLATLDASRTRPRTGERTFTRDEMNER